MGTVSIQCPCCKASCELALEEGRDVIALTCPSCEAGLVYYHGQTFQIDPAELRYLKARGHVRETRAWVRSSEEDDDPTSVTESDEASPSRPPRREIGEDDITNLRIDLERCVSVDDFLKRLG